MKCGVLNAREPGKFIQKEIEINEVPITTDDWIIAYNNDIIVGARQWFGPYTDVPAMGFDGFSETFGYCDIDNTPIFKVYQHSTGNIIDMDGQIPIWNPQTNYIIEKLVDSNAIPDGYKLENPYPNPFNPIVNLDFSIPQNDMTNISIYDITGRLVQELFSDIKDAGYYSIQWNAINYASGIYFIKISTDNFIQTKKVTLLK